MKTIGGDFLLIQSRGKVCIIPKYSSKIERDKFRVKDGISRKPLSDPLPFTTAPGSKTGGLQS